MLSSSSTITSKVPFLSHPSWSVLKARWIFFMSLCVLSIISTKLFLRFRHLAPDCHYCLIIDFNYYPHVIMNGWVWALCNMIPKFDSIISKTWVPSQPELSFISFYWVALLSRPSNLEVENMKRSIKLQVFLAFLDILKCYSTLFNTMGFRMQSNCLRRPQVEKRFSMDLKFRTWVHDIKNYFIHSFSDTLAFTLKHYEPGL